MKRRKKNTQELVISYFLGIIFLFILTLLVSSNIKIYKRRKLLKEQIAEKTEYLENLKESNHQNNYSHESDDFIIEKIAREQLLLKKEGEKVVVVQVPKKEDIEEEQEEKQIIWWNPLTWNFKDQNSG